MCVSSHLVRGMDYIFVLPEGGTWRVCTYMCVHTQLPCKTHIHIYIQVADFGFGLAAFCSKARWKLSN